MKIHKSIKADDVYLDLVAGNLKEALETIANLLSGVLSISSDIVVDGLLEREQLGSTSVGHGFAIPHCKLQGLRQIRVALARFQAPIAFGSSSAEMVRFVFVVLSPPDQPAAHLQVLSQIARILKRDDLRSKLLDAKDSTSVLDAIQHVAETEGL